MSTNRINGKSFDIRVMGLMLHVESFNLTIEDNSTTAKNKGVPDGTLAGDVAASGEIELDIANFMILSAAARAAGSWRNIPTFPIDAYASGESSRGDELMHVRAHGCKLRISEVLSIDPNSTDKSKVKLPYDVTSPDFVWINGTPYVPGSEFELF
ncbi:phage protein [Thalassolituus sp. UBA2009]|uniref:phage protein n=1 Tax=Thalassolituus sp. UBA2009 TaxID=1947658 RepID=UPI00257E2AFA|nr:phage protein [Thalassolituus sp. UBA2009]